MDGDRAVLVVALLSIVIHGSDCSTEMTMSHRPAIVQLVGRSVLNTLQQDGVGAPQKLVIESDYKNLDLHDWLLPCSWFINRNKRTERQWTSSIVNFIRVVAFLKCVILSETIHLPADILVDYRKAVKEFVDGNASLKKRLTSLALLPFTFVTSIRDLITKIAAYVIVSLLPLVW